MKKFTLKTLSALLALTLLLSCCLPFALALEDSADSDLTADETSTDESSSEEGLDDSTEDYIDGESGENVTDNENTDDATEDTGTEEEDDSSDDEASAASDESSSEEDSADEDSTDEDATDEDSSDDEDGDGIPDDNIVIEGDAVLTRGSRYTYPSALGDYSTYYYTIDGKIAYCLEADMASPKSGSYSQSVYSSNANLNKALYYGYGGAGDITAEYFPNYSKKVRYILTHIAASYFYTGSYSRATKGCTSSGLAKYGVDDWISYLESLPEPPSPSISFSDSSLSVVSVSDGIQVTETVTLNADSRNTITMTLPDEVTYHNQDTGESQTGGTVTISGGTTFYFSAPSSLEGLWETGKMTGSISVIWKVLAVETGTKTQVLGTYATASYGGSVALTVDWVGEIELTILKADSEDSSVLLSSAEFEIFSDASCQELLATVVTDEDGSASCSISGTLSTVYVRESSAPAGYELNETVYSVDLSAQSDLTILIQDDAIVVPMGQLTIYKTGEQLVGYSDGQFIYEQQALSGVTFEIIAAEDFYEPDYVLDEDGNRVLIYACNEVVATLTTGSDGTVTTDSLPLGTYIVRELSTASGYMLDETEYSVTLTQEDPEAEISFETLTLENTRQNVSVSVVKRSDDGTALAGAQFALYAGEDIVANGVVIVSAGTCIATGITDDFGTLTFDVDLPLGCYLINEISAPDGYVLSDEIHAITAESTNSSDTVISLTAEFADAPTQVAISKADVTTGVELSGASMTLYDSEGNVIDSWTSVADEPHLVEGLTIGETYTLQEDIAPYGYLISNSIQFTVSDTSEVQKVVMYDEVPTGTIIINKQGDFLSSVTAVEEASGWISSVFSYITGNLQDVTFGVYAYEDIAYADGVSGNYYNAGDYVATITTDSTGIAILEGLPLGIYYVQEIATADGYVLDDEIRIIDLSYRDSETAVVTYSADWLNDRCTATVQVVKTDADGETLLEGAVFGLYTAEDIYSGDTIVIEKDTLIEQRATDSTGTLTFSADLPVGYSYYVKEITPPDGYATGDTIATFSFDADTADEEYTFSFTFANELTTVEFVKTDENSDPLEGAALALLDESGEVVESWVSDSEAYVITGLVVGETYTLTETQPADGYVTAESITFTVSDTADIQTIIMQDDVTRVEILKTDEDANPLEGANLAILDENGDVIESWVSDSEAYIITGLVVGETYTLTETQPADGYVTAESITFTVSDTADTQTIIMQDDVTRVEILKTDEDGNPLEGATLAILDENGDEIESWVSDSETYVIEKLPIGTYYLHEDEAPSGYGLAGDIEFEVTDSAETVTVVMVDTILEEDVIVETPQTGDTSKPILWIGLAFIGIAGIVSAVIGLKSRRKN